MQGTQNNPGGKKLKNLYSQFQDLQKSFSDQDNVVLTKR